MIRSPVDGALISRLVEVGQRLSANFAIPTLFLIAEDVTQMQWIPPSAKWHLGGMSTEEKTRRSRSTRTREAVPRKVRPGRNAPINIQNVVTYDVVIGVERIRPR